MEGHRLDPGKEQQGGAQPMASWRVPVQMGSQQRDAGPGPAQLGHRIIWSQLASQGSDSLPIRYRQVWCVRIGAATSQDCCTVAGVTTYSSAWQMASSK